MIYRGQDVKQETAQDVKQETALREAKEASCYLTTKASASAEKAEGTVGARSRGQCRTFARV